VKAGEGGSRGRNGAEEKGKEGTQQEREGSKQEGEARGEGEGEVIEGTDSDLYHPTTVDGENSCSLRESGSLKDSNEWHKEWQ